MPRIHVLFWPGHEVISITELHAHISEGRIQGREA